MGDLYHSARKEHFSIAYVQALAYTAGYSVQVIQVDAFGVDLELRDRAMRIDVQMKCMTEDANPKPRISYDLDARTYNLLCDPGRIVPAYLFVVEIPADQNGWIDCTPAGIHLYKCGYYADMSVLQETENKTSRVVHVERANRLTVDSLDRLMKESRSGR